MASPRVHVRCTARDGRPFVIREGDAGDAAQLIGHARAILSEPEWNISEPHEFNLTLEEEKTWIEGFRKQPHSILLVADAGGPGASNVVGVLSFKTQPRYRMRHRGRLGIGVQVSYRGVGIGEALLRVLLEWAAVESELERVELSVLAHNTRAINLYRKLGFEVEGRGERAFKLADGSYYDDLQMVRWVK
jgi:RimJ/RimL family protein N-acetyltransferase